MVALWWPCGGPVVLGPPQMHLGKEDGAWGRGQPPSKGLEKGDGPAGPPARRPAWEGGGGPVAAGPYIIIYIILYIMYIYIYSKILLRASDFRAPFSSST